MAVETAQKPGADEGGWGQAIFFPACSLSAEGASCHPQVRELSLFSQFSQCLGSGALWEGPCSHFTDEDMEVQGAWQGNPRPCVRSWGSFFPAPCSLVHGFVSAAAPAPQPGS